LFADLWKRLELERDEDMHTIGDFQKVIDSPSNNLNSKGDPDFQASFDRITSATAALRGIRLWQVSTRGMHNGK
jgi:hypothetical protein